MNKLNKVLETYKELTIILLIVAVLGIIVIPIPHEAMDVLIGLNIGLTVIVLMTVLYMQSPLELTSFPSILLVLALFRIGITISSSRLILLTGNAGQIIETFGNFVVGGDLMVGVIIFSIITIINFIVITKGSERVAEVSARFSLDAMPGKQMSIDSDLRSNNIDMNEAKRKRNQLGQESQLFGAMDGAMKFVKGDAIASIIDILINIIGGLVIGMLKFSLPFIDALHKYTLLTVGDGLVQQIPALLISLTAGIMVTRVNDDDNADNLGKNIIVQLFNRPKVLFSASSLFVLLALIPGMPTIVFIVLALAMIAIGIALQRKNSKQAQASASDEKNQDSDKIIEKADEINETKQFKIQPLIFNLSDNLKQSDFLVLIKECLIDIKRDIRFNLGIEIPQIVIKYNNQIEDDSYQILLYEIPLTTGKFYPNAILVLDDSIESQTVLAKYKIAENSVNLGLPKMGNWYTMGAKEQCQEFGIDYISSQQFIQMHISLILQKNATEFIGIQEVKVLIEQSDYQEDIRELMRSALPLNKLTEVFQRLITENISIRNMRVIVNTLIEWALREKEIVLLVEYIRQALGRYISHKYSSGTNLLPCFFLDDGLESLVRDAIRFNDKGSYLALNYTQEVEIVEKIKQAYAQQGNMKIQPVIITHMDIRRYIRSLVEKEIPYANVLSFQEVEPYAKFNGLGIIEV